MKKIKNRTKVLVGISLFFLFAAAGIGRYIFSTYSKLHVVKVKPEDLGAKPKTSSVNTSNNLYAKGEEVINIALLGVDTRSLESDKGTRSDCMMVLTIDRKHKKIKVASVLRDSYVKIEGRGLDKITHAYAFGGPMLAVKTLNQNFDLNIQNFVVVNFFGLAEIIDELGGVDIEIDESELKHVDVQNTGMQHLNGTQAVAYSRIRYTAGGDFKRTERQREVLFALIKKFENITVSQMVTLVSKIAPNLKTSLSPSDIVQLGTEVITNGYNHQLAQGMFPSDEYSKGKKINGIYYYVTDLAKAKQDIQKFVYEK